MLRLLRSLCNHDEVPKFEEDRAAKAFLETLSLELPAFYESIPKIFAKKAAASEPSVSSWNGYLIKLTRELGITKIHIVDEGLRVRLKIWRW